MVGQYEQADYWFQVRALTDLTFPSTSSAEDLSKNLPVSAVPSSALWVLLIHALGSYVCYISGTSSVILSGQTCSQQSP